MVIGSSKFETIVFSILFGPFVLEALHHLKENQDAYDLTWAKVIARNAEFDLDHIRDTDFVPTSIYLNNFKKGNLINKAFEVLNSAINN